MPIKFHCEYCGNLVEAPDDAGGKRGKCPHCQRSNFIPAPEGQEPLELAPLNEEDERRRQREVERAMAADRELLAETQREEVSPRLSQKDPEEVSAVDLHHMVVNYCLDMVAGQLQRAPEHAEQLSQYGDKGRQAVLDFISGKVLEPALDRSPLRVLQGYLKELQKLLS
jgi:phage FluMu protein Com